MRKTRKRAVSLPPTPPPTHCLEQKQSALRYYAKVVFGVANNRRPTVDVAKLAVRCKLESERL